MRWEGRRESDNVEDRRGQSAGFGGMPGGRMAVGGSMGTIVIVILVALVFGVNPLQLLQQQPGGGPGIIPPGQQQPREQPGGMAEENDPAKRFVSVVLADTEEVWDEQFRKLGREYRKPKLVLFSGQVNSACGFADAAVGPFYCPADEKLYIDLTFFDDMKRQLGAPGDFAQAYVIAHEVGHHVQKLLGVSEQVQAQRRRLSKEDYNKLSVRMELQADFYAGLWANHAQQTKNILEPGDIEEALTAANAIGDDRLQKQSRGTVVPDSFTHGTSAQRVRWFKRGFTTGDIRQGDTFALDDDEL